MIHNIIIGLLLFVLTTAIHTGGMLLAMGRFKALLKSHGSRHRHSRLYLVGVVANSMFLVSVVEIFVWALAYLAAGAVEGIEKAFYFSAVTFTTLGYGDITPLSSPAQFLSLLEAITGQFYLAVIIARLVGMHISQSISTPDGN